MRLNRGLYMGCNTGSLHFHIQPYGTTRINDEVTLSFHRDHAFFSTIEVGCGLLEFTYSISTDNEYGYEYVHDQIFSLDYKILDYTEWVLWGKKHVAQKIIKKYLHFQVVVLYSVPMRCCAITTVAYVYAGHPSHHLHHRSVNLFDILFFGFLFKKKPQSCRERFGLTGLGQRNLAVLAWFLVDTLTGSESLGMSILLRVYARLLYTLALSGHHAYK